jgi:hypothetical protein
MKIELNREITIEEVAPVVERHMYEALSKVAEFIAL